MSSSDVISPQIMYKKFQQHGPKYKYVRINMSNILSNKVALTDSASQEIHFKLPNNTVMNLSKSRCNCDFFVPAQGAGYCSNLLSDCWPFMGNVSVETGNGTQLLNLTNSSKYTK